MMHMGMIVKDIRKSLKWSGQKLADKAGVGITTVRNIESTGHGYLETYEKLLDVMGYEIDIVKKELRYVD